MDRRNVTEGNAEPRWLLRPAARTPYVGCNKRSALHRITKQREQSMTHSTDSDHARLGGLAPFHYTQLELHKLTS